MATMKSGDKMMGLGDFLWDYSPITPWINFLRGATGQYGLVNVNNMKTEEPDTELEIIQSVGSYGKQLGRVIEALQAVCQQLEKADWTIEQREAVADFNRLAEDIDKYKSEHLPVRKGSLDEIKAALRDLKRKYPQPEEPIGVNGPRKSG